MAYFLYLRTFMNVYRSGSYGNAAETLNMSQPTISNHITSLEQQLGKPLFKRTENGGKRYKPTKVARDLARELSPHIDRIEEIFISTRGHPKSLQGTVHIGGLTEFIERHLTHTITALMPENIRFIIQYEGADHWIDLLEEQSIDLAILPMPIYSEKISYKEFISDPLVMVAHSDFVNAGAPLEYLLDLSFISYAPQLPCIQQFLASFPDTDNRLNTLATTSSFSMIKDMLLNKAGFSILPKPIVKEELEKGILFEANTDLPTVDMRLYLAWNKQSMQKPKNIFVRDAILETAKTYKI